ncbi:MAG: GAF domain-containing protein [Myxococcales bacterium]|nr:MAG: GAF domain-containing protein [Myxococcales bacterium]
MFSEALALYLKLEHRREYVETLLDIVECELRMQSVFGTWDQQALLDEAEAIAQTDTLDDLLPRLLWLKTYRTRDMAPEQKLLTAMEVAVVAARAKGDLEYVWRLEWLRGEFLDKGGNPQAAEAAFSAAYRVLAQMRENLPHEMQDGFLQEKFRHQLWLRVGGQKAAQSTMREHSNLDKSEGVEDMIEKRRVSFLFEIVRRIIAEDDLARLLERVVEGALNFFEAERGMILLLNQAGELEPKIVSQVSAPSDTEFSRSIAEAVLIDNEAIVTLDARNDTRLTSYRSVHRLMLKSVACLPIRGQKETIGVLYLEHRSAQGRFAETDLALLLAFADQAALAIEKAQWAQAMRERGKELQRLNDALSRAAEEKEKLLHAREEELGLIRKELKAASKRLHDENEFCGIVGQTAPMRMLFRAD